MDGPALAALVEKDPSFGRLVCRCERITEGEIRASIRARVGARTLDGVKRRTRSSMGRCQGGFCTPRLIEILGSELGIPPEEFLVSRKTAPAALRTGNRGGLGGAGGDEFDVVVVGAGPAGLAAACAAKDAGAQDVLVIERDVIAAMRQAAVRLPVKIGDTIIRDAAGTGVDVVATANLSAH